jgi:pilus assembly protein CpaE
MPDDNSQVKISVRDQNVKAQLETIIESCSGLKISKRQNGAPADLLIHELGPDAETEIQQISSLLNLNNIGEVFLIAAQADSDVLMKAIKAGVKAFFSLPLEEREVKDALEKFTERKRKGQVAAPTRRGRIIDIIGSKGGIGATTVAVNVAVSLATNGLQKSVALVDMNMLFGEIPIFLSIDPRYHWGEVVENMERLDETFLMNILSQHASGVHVLPSPGYLDKKNAVTPEIMERILRLMQELFDVIIVDGGQSFNPIFLKAIQMSDQVLLLSLLSLPCLANINRLLSSLEDDDYLSRDQLRVVINRYQKKSVISLTDARKSIENDIFWTIPNDYQTTISAINQGKSLSQIAPKAEVTRNLEKLAEELLSGEEDSDGKRFNKKPRKKWKHFLSRKHSATEPTR